MGLVKGVNCGLVLTKPTLDPASGSRIVCDQFTWAMKVTTPAVIAKVTEIGFWVDNATEDRNFDVGIYTHDVGEDEPLDRLAGAIFGKAKGLDAGWKRSDVLNIALNPNTIYWISVHLFNTPSTTNLDYLADGGEKADYKNGDPGLENPWPGSVTSLGWLLGIYALYVETTANPYPTNLLKKEFISAYHCFMSGYLRAKVEGFDPLKLPDGTVF